MNGYLVEIESKAEDDFVISKAEALATNYDRLDYWLGAEDLDNDGVWKWTTSGNPLVYTNWWGNPGKLNSTCAQLLRKGGTEPGILDSFYWTMASTPYDCQKGKDGDNGLICEMDPDVQL